MTRTTHEAIAIRLMAGVVLLLHAARADAYNYSLSAYAGGDQQATSDISIDALSASYLNPLEPSASHESYTASAWGDGALSAHAESVGIPPFAPISHSATARIEETIRLGPPHPFPSGPVTVTAGIAADLAVLLGGTVAKASGQVQIEPFSETCAASVSTDAAPSGWCPAGSAGEGTVTRTFTLEELAARSYEIDVAGQVSATLELFAADGESSSSASGGLWVHVSGGGLGDADYRWSGTNTVIPTPEPTPQALGAAALFALALRRRRR
ncbi:MAG: hypothetical protein OZ948_09195 [Deltaproteobacteria bacterium]|nr:hypothetical protein [Deltaproteobacteria bacterium]